jgi:hypothetical protein
MRLGLLDTNFELQFSLDIIRSMVSEKIFKLFFVKISLIFIFCA